MPAGQTDLAPTVLSLLGIDRGAAAVSRTQPARRRRRSSGAASRTATGSTRAICFSPGAADTACFDLGRRVAGPASDCAAEDAQARRARELSRLIVLEDLQQALRARLAANPNP